VTFQDAAGYAHKADGRSPHQKIVPLVNIDSLMPKRDSAKKGNAS
jgi:hypothetical protein